MRKFNEADTEIARALYPEYKYRDYVYAVEQVQPDQLFSDLLVLG